MMMTANLGFPRMGIERELKKALEAYWKGEISQENLLETGRMLRIRHWQLQKTLGIEQIPSNDFSFYDHVLDTLLMTGAVPSRFLRSGEQLGLDTYFRMARGDAEAAAMEMTKWFDTNYHYIVPEFEEGQTFRLRSEKVLREFEEAKELGILTRPVLLGPLTFLRLGKSKGSLKKGVLLENLLPVYEEVLGRLREAGADWVQMDEPILVLDMSAEEERLFQRGYSRLLSSPHPKICLTAYFGTISDKLPWLTKLPVDAVHLDLVRAPEQLEAAMEMIPEPMMLSMGIVNGRNIWKANLTECLEKLYRAAERLGTERLMVASSCSLLHCPLDLAQETALPAEIRQRMAFAVQKLQEIHILTRAVREGRQAVEPILEENQRLFSPGKTSRLFYNPEVRNRMNRLTDSMFSRQSGFEQRRRKQRQRLRLPLFPTTTIGSFPQTPEIRKARADFKKGILSETEYRSVMKHEIEKVIRFQESVWLDVLVHGEPERNDMVEYFGEMLDGFAFTQNGWVQSYGSRCVKPPVIYGDVRRRAPMTVYWIQYAQSLTDKPVKGMLTGPMTLLQWSFVREDQPRRDTAFQLALAVRDEAADLEAAGIRIIQIDEPGLCEGVPLRQSERTEYFDWAVKAFRLASCGVKDETQIHTHMCYADFNDRMDAIIAMDADVLSIEASRSGAVLLEVFERYRYPNEIGPGVYDIHSPRVPSVEEMVMLLNEMLRHLRAEQIWVNPDCGLKTRGWPETEASLKNMVQAAVRLRQSLGG
ncbi:MAG: 5-methyltetrahydropteroyltriglutamate--homocysteine S-methyltransferase [Anaerohalosphaeraceae bacterium]